MVINIDILWATSSREFLGKVKVGAQLTPSRQFIIRDVERLIPLVSDTFTPMESLAYGGLGNGWGLGCFVFSDPELDRAGLDRSEMKEAYETVSQRIGISAVRDDAASYTLGSLKHSRRHLRIDRNCQHLYESYQRKRASLNESGFFMGQPAMAILNEDLGNGKKLPIMIWTFIRTMGFPRIDPG